MVNTWKWYIEEVYRDLIHVGDAFKDEENQVEEGNSGRNIMTSGFEGH
jgi:hypothetical protein